MALPWRAAGDNRHHGADPSLDPNRVQETMRIMRRCDVHDNGLIEQDPNPNPNTDIGLIEQA